MTPSSQSLKILVFCAIFGLSSCSDDEKSGLRPAIDYSLVTPQTPYSSLFVDVNGTTTVDLRDGSDRHKMFQALNYYMSSSTAANAEIDATVLQHMLENTNNPFVDIETTTINVVGAELNAADVALREVIASSRPGAEAEAARSRMDNLFAELQTASLSANEVAEAGVAGKLGNYLVDVYGIEIAQIIQKSLIGALQLDYIGNVLLDEGLLADNQTVVSGHNYTALEHNWDIAYGLLTLNPIYLEGATDATRNSIEFGAGSYIWEYNKASYAQIFPAFLKGRAAIINNDRATLEAQATLIRTAFEKAIGNAALGYLEKWKTGVTDAARAHAIGEALGFIYSLRFASLHNIDAAFSDNLIEVLIVSANGFWDLDATKINTASDAIKLKFGL